MNRKPAHLWGADCERLIDVLDCSVLIEEECAFRGTGGISQENEAFGFRPAFKDTETNIVYLACFRNGRPAPIHVLDGLPGVVVQSRDTRGYVLEVKGTMVTGFVRDGIFYTRQEAAQIREQEKTGKQSIANA